MTRREVLVLAGLLALSPTGCASLRRAPPPAVTTELGAVRVEFEEWDEATQGLLARVLPDAARPVTRWGKLEEPVRILVVNSHWELEEKAGRRLPELSAWATRNQIILHDPRWWPMPPSVENDRTLEAEVRQRVVTQLLTHELTHCLMFQLAGPTPSDPRNRIPFWFREGMAAYTAGEPHRVARQSLIQWIAANPKDDPLSARTGLTGDPVMAYGSALYAFAFLIDRGGEDAVRRILLAMRSGKAFPEAFGGVVAEGTSGFRQEFEQSLGRAR